MKHLSNWYHKIARPLPWRENHDPYRIWISEVMLQQTQVETVIDYYHRFLKRFPTLSSLAHAPEQEVLALWSGLGYYRRAKNLRLGAQFIQSRGGKFPRTREEILEVPGIGPYTAGAILSIAFDLPEPLVDGNVQRVFARYYGVREAIQNTRVQKLFWQKAHQEVIKAKSPRIHNQALMELGSLICKKSEPMCERCPISYNCFAFEKGIQKKLPVSKPRKAPKDLHWIGIIPKKTSAGKKELYFLKQNRNTPWWEGLWDFPRIEKPLNMAWDKAPSLLEDTLKRKLKITPLNHTRHSVTHHRIQVAPFIVDLKGNLSFSWKERGERATERWLTLEEISQMPLSGLAKKIFRQLPL